MKKTPKPLIIDNDYVDEMLKKLRELPKLKTYTCSVCGKEVTDTRAYVSYKTKDIACYGCFNKEYQLSLQALLTENEADIKKCIDYFFDNESEAEDD